MRAIDCRRPRVGRSNKAVSRTVPGYCLTLDRRGSRAAVAGWCLPGGGGQPTAGWATAGGASSAAAEAAPPATPHPPHHGRARTILMTPARYDSKNFELCFAQL